VGRQGWQHTKFGQEQVGIASTSLFSCPISVYSRSINYKVYPFESFTLSPFIKCLVVGQLSLFTFMSLWVCMKPWTTTKKFQNT